MKQYIFTIIFELLILGSQIKTRQTYWYVSLWSEITIHTKSPNLTYKNMPCSGLIRINGEKVKINYKIGGIEINPEILNSRKGKRF